MHMPFIILAASAMLLSLPASAPAPSPEPSPTPTNDIFRQITSACRGKHGRVRPAVPDERGGRRWPDFFWNCPGRGRLCKVVA